MNNMRRGFTMIELIFVIVIIGILAAVAIPKLTATRDDAKISKTVANLRTVVEDVKNYYTANGEDTTTNPDGAWGVVTYSVVTDAIPQNTAGGITTGGTGVLPIDGETGTTCFNVTEGTRTRTINGIDVTQRTLTVSDGGGGGTICPAAQALAQEKGLYNATTDVVHVFAGQGVAF